MTKWMLTPVIIACLSTQAFAQSHSGEAEFTPGPRMIRAIEQIAGHYVHFRPALGLTAEQTDKIAALVKRMKTEMWMKEAVLVGMFQELEEKRRHGLLQDNEYRTANALTGGIETDELNLFIDTLAELRGVLTSEQQATLRAAAHAPLEFRLIQGFNTKIGLMSLEGIGRVYNAYREELRLTDAQAQAIRALLETARREVLRVGTEIDLSRVESDELVLRPDVDPEVIRAKMQKTGETEGVLFNKLFETSDRIEALLSGDQRKTLGRLKQHRQRQAGSAGRSGRHVDGHGEPRAAGFDYFLDQSEWLELTEEQVAALVGAKNETRKTVLIEEAKLKGAELELLGVLRRQNRDGAVSHDQLATAVQRMEAVRSNITRVKALGYLKAREVLTPEQQRRVHPPQTLIGSR